MKAPQIASGTVWLMGSRVRPPLRFAAWLFVAVLFFLLSGCSSKTVQQLNSVSYTPGREDVAVVGTPFIWRETGTVESSEHWEGVLFGGMHHSYLKGNDYQRTELFYGGRSGETLTFLYQVTTGNNATPSVRQTSQINLAEGNHFAVDGLEIQCVEADSNSIRYIVLSADPRWGNPTTR